jgi:hypothetical protein
MDNVATTFAMGTDDPTPAMPRNDPAGARAFWSEKGVNKLSIYSVKSKFRF